MDLTQQRLEELDRLQLEHGLRRRSPLPRRRLARPHLHQGRAHPHRPREALPRQSTAPATGASTSPPSSTTPPASPGTIPPPSPGRTIPFSHIYIAHADHDTAATINAQLARGKNLLLTPGIYDLTEPIRVTHPNTVVLGLGFATLHPTNGNAALTTADADGIILAGLLIDAGEQLSPVLVQIGPHNSTARHQHDPISLSDVFFRVGGADLGRADINLEINANDTLVDHTWIWRADHGDGVGWDKNLSNNGLVVNGNDVTVYGLFVEHHQQFQVLWNGNHGRTYFYQSEIPYDPPTQSAYTSAPGTDGWASYKVADTVTHHEAWGLGVYSVFTYPNVFLSHAIEAPTTPNVRFHDMITVCLETNGGIRHIIDNQGDPTVCAPHRVDPKLTLYPSTLAASTR